MLSYLFGNSNQNKSKKIKKVKRKQPVNNFYGMEAGKDYYADIDDGFYTQTRRTNEVDTIGEDKSDSQQTFEYITKDVHNCDTENITPPFSVNVSELGYGVPACVIDTDSKLRNVPLTRPRGPITNPGPLPLPTKPYEGYGSSRLDEDGAVSTEYRLWAGDFSNRDRSFLPVTTEYYNLHFPKGDWGPNEGDFLHIGSAFMETRSLSQKTLNLRGNI